MPERFGEIKQRLLKLAEAGSDIKAIIEIGSQTREQTPADQFSDLDLILATSEPERYLCEDELISRLGSPLISFVEPTLAGAKERRILFEGSLDVDIVVVTPGQLSRAIGAGELGGILARGSRVLFDRMGAAESLKFAPDPIPGGPMSLQEYTNTVNDFWFHIVWAAKKLRRGELYTAVACVNGYISSLLLEMIELCEKCRHSMYYDVWHNGRLLELWAGEDVREGLRGCFTPYDSLETAEALRALENLYSRLARASAEALQYPYPEKAEQSALKILNNLLENQ